MKALVSLKNESGNVIPKIGLSITVLRSTLDELPKIEEFYKQMKLDGGISVQALQRMDSYTKNYPNELKDEFLSEGEIVSLYEKYNIENLKNAYGIEDFVYLLFKGFDPKSDGCPWLKHGIFINYEGYAFPCCMVRDRDVFSFGKIGVDSSNTILEKKEKMRQSLLSGEIPMACNGCFIVQRTILLPKQGINCLF
ncbi:MAG: SPASM domain-containing protein [Oligoflexales bacterium]|nr:SPASM domain-containing protein [Oligoflexales bacterium]